MAAETWDCQGTVLQAGPLPLLMGILNVTPDSFSDGGNHDSVEAAVQHGLQLVADGADIIDVGGESTRPGAAVVDTDEELRRTIPVIEQLTAETDVPVSIDTTKAVVAERAIAAGACIVNDISGLTFDQDMPKVCRDTEAGVCLMHIRGTPQTMQENPVYEDVVREITEHLRRRVDECCDFGIAPERLCIDPGIGFGKTAEHNLQLLQSAEQLRQTLERPLLIGHSRKRFLSKLLGRPVEERLAGTVGISIALAQQRTDILRIHDVAVVRDALLAWHRVHNPAGAGDDLSDQ